jgi:hypothetical protein
MLNILNLNNMKNDYFNYYQKHKSLKFSNENQFLTENSKNHLANYDSKSLESNILSNYNYFDNNPFNLYTSINTNLQNSYIPLKGLTIRSEHLKSTLFRQSSIKFKSKLLTIKPDNKIYKNKLSIQNVENIFIPKQQNYKNSNKCDKMNLSISSDENLINDIIKLKTILNEQIPKFQKVKTIKYLTDKNKKTISKIYEKDFNPEYLFNQYKRECIKTEKKEKAFQKMLKDYNKYNLEEEINFSISDISKESIKTFENNCESVDNSIKRNLFSDNLIFSKNSTKDWIELSTLKMIRNETDSELNHLTKDNTDFELTNFICTNNSERSSSIKKVKFLDDTELFNYDKKRQIYLSNKKYKRKKQNKIKSILIKRDNSCESEIDKQNLIKKDKLLALDSLNKLISECELESNILPIDASRNLKSQNCSSKNLFNDINKKKQIK